MFQRLSMLPSAHTRREAFNTEVEPFVQCFTNYIFEIRSLEVEFQILVFDKVAGGLHRLPDSTFVLLGQHIAARSRPLLELAVCEQNRFGKGRHTCRGAKSSRASHPGGPGALCAGSLTVRG